MEGDFVDSFLCVRYSLLKIGLPVMYHSSIIFGSEAQYKPFILFIPCAPSAVIDKDDYVYLRFYF